MTKAGSTKINSSTDRQNRRQVGEEGKSVGKSPID